MDSKRKIFEKNFEEMDTTHYEAELTMEERNNFVRQNIKMPQDVLPNMTRKYYEYKPDGEIVAFIDRTYADEVAIVLPCGYFQRFWVDCTDKQALSRIENMKREGFKSA